MGSVGGSQSLHRVADPRAVEGLTQFVRGLRRWLSIQQTLTKHLLCTVARGSPVLVLTAAHTSWCHSLMFPTVAAECGSTQPLGMNVASLTEDASWDIAPKCRAQR